VDQDGSRCLTERLLAVQRDERVDPRAHRFDPIEVSLHDLHGARRSRCDGGSQLGRVAAHQVRTIHARNPRPPPCRAPGLTAWFALVERGHVHGGGRPTAFDQAVYAGRNVVERCFNRFEQFRGLATVTRNALPRAEIIHRLDRVVAAHGPTGHGLDDRFREVGVQWP